MPAETVAWSACPVSEFVLAVPASSGVDVLPHLALSLYARDDRISALVRLRGSRSDRTLDPGPCADFEPWWVVVSDVIG